MSLFSYFFQGGLEDDVKSLGRSIDRQVLRPIANTVEKVVQNPRALASLAIAIAAPGLGATIGNSILSTFASGAISQTAATAVGNFVLQSAISGDPEKALKNVGGALIGAEISEALSAELSSALGSEAGGKFVARVIGDAADLAVRGGNSKDIATALARSAASAGFDKVTENFEAYQELPLMARGFAKNLAIQTAIGNIGNANFSLTNAINGAVKETLAQRALDEIGPEIGMSDAAKKAAMDFVSARISGADVGKAAFGTLTNSLKDELRGLSSANKSVSRIFGRDASAEDLKSYVGLSPEEVEQQIETRLIAGDLPGIDNPENSPDAIRSINSYRSIASRLETLAGDEFDVGDLRSAAFDAIYNYDRDDLKTIVRDAVQDDIPDYLRNRGVEDAIVSNITRPGAQADLDLEEMFTVRPGQEPDNPYIFDYYGVRAPTDARASNEDIAQLAAQILGDPSKIGWQQYYGKSEKEVADLMRTRALSVDDALEDELGRPPTLEERYNYYKQPINTIRNLIDEEYVRPDELDEFFMDKLNREPTAEELERFGDNMFYLGKGQAPGASDPGDLLSYIDDSQKDLADDIADRMGLKSTDVRDQIYKQIQSGNFDDFPTADDFRATNVLSDDFTPTIYQNNQLREPDDSKLTIGEYDQMLNAFFGDSNAWSRPDVTQAIYDGRLTERQAADLLKDQFRGYNEDFIDMMGRAPTAQELGQFGSMMWRGEDAVKAAYQDLYNLPSEKREQFKSIFGRDPTDEDVETYDLDTAGAGYEAQNKFVQNLTAQASNERAFSEAKQKLINAGVNPTMAEDLAQQAKGTQDYYGRLSPGKTAEEILRNARSELLNTASREGQPISDEQISEYLKADKPFTEAVQTLRDTTDKAFTSLEEAEQSLIDAGFSPGLASMYKYQAYGPGDNRVQDVINNQKDFIRQIAQQEGVELTDPEIQEYLSSADGFSLFSKVQQDADARYTTRDEALKEFRDAGFSQALTDSLIDKAIGFGEGRATDVINDFRDQLSAYSDAQGYELTPEQMAEYLSRPVGYTQLVSDLTQDILDAQPTEEIPYDEQVAEAVADAQAKFEESGETLADLVAPATKEEETAPLATDQVTGPVTEDVITGTEEQPVITEGGEPETVEQEPADFLPPYTPGEDAAEFQPSDIVSETEDLAPYTPGEDAEEFQPPVTETEDLLPPYTPGEDAEEFVPPYTPGEDAEEFVPPYTPGEDAAELIPPYTPGEDAEEFIPPYTPGEDAEEFVQPYTPGEDAADFVQPYTPGEDAEEFVPPYTPGEDAEEFIPPYTPGEDAAEFIPPYTPGEDAEEFIPPYTPGEDAEEFIPPYTPGEDATDFLPEDTETEFDFEDFWNRFFKYLRPTGPETGPGGRPQLDPKFLEWLRKRGQPGGGGTTQPPGPGGGTGGEPGAGGGTGGGTGGAGAGTLVPSQQTQGADIFGLLGLMSLLGGGQKPATPQRPEYKVAELEEPVDFSEIWTPYSDSENKTPYGRL